MTPGRELVEMTSLQSVQNQNTQSRYVLVNSLFNKVKVIVISANKIQQELYFLIIVNKKKPQNI